MPYLRPQREDSFQEPRAQCNQLNLTGGAPRRTSKRDSVEIKRQNGYHRVERAFSGRAALRRVHRFSTTPPRWAHRLESGAVWVQTYDAVGTSELNRLPTPWPCVT